MRTTFCLITSILMLASAFNARADEGGQVLETATFRVTITERCEEGVIGCEDVQYHGLSRKNGTSIRLNGKTRMVMCADGVTPCHVLGYEFHNGPYTYMAYEQGLLEVRKGAKVIFSEKGKWLDQ